MSIADSLASLPGSTRIESVTIGTRGSTVDEIRAALANGGQPAYITTTEAARRFSYSAETWAKWAPDIHGAYKDRMWRLPLAACEAHVAALARPRRMRGPWKAPKTATAPAGRSRPPHLQVR